MENDLKTPQQMLNQMREVREATERFIAAYMASEVEAIKSEAQTALNHVLYLLRKTTNQLILGSAPSRIEAVCRHCQDNPIIAKGVCLKCYDYQRYHGVLPGPDVLDKRK